MSSKPALFCRTNRQSVIHEAITKAMVPEPGDQAQGPPDATAPTMAGPARESAGHGGLAVGSEMAQSLESHFWI
ncbi:hypothetical protein [Brucella rhizosphaerae]|uniref:hypothetical protein n=1 Tax=Brucella rhizosphaerae TaxID=571254 RepID=UPI0004B56E04|nr:hypothetical protein [Brucella rhizosphaerae]